MDTQEWFDDLLSRADGLDFDKSILPDIFEVTVHKGDQVFATWDITDELFDNGMSRKKYINASLNVDLEFIFIHEDMAEHFKDDESFQKIMAKFMNDSLNFAWTANTTVWHMDRGNMHYSVLFYVQGALTLALGLAGLALKLKSPSPTMVVKVTRLSQSFWFILIGILQVMKEVSRHFVFAGRSFEQLLLVIDCTTGTLMKTSLMSLKIFTLSIYAFQNTMLYRPFYFREHKKVLGRWFLRLALGQSVAAFVGFLVWSMVLMYHKDDDCAGIFDRGEKWNLAQTSMTCIGYTGSLFLSVMFTIGYYREKNREVGKAEARNIRTVMINCSVEILFDATVLIVRAAASSHFDWFKYQFGRFIFRDQATIESKCDMLTRLQALDSGVTGGTIAVLILQPTVQEICFLIVAFIDHFKGTNS